MPEPMDDETRNDFLDRCMGDDEAVADFQDPDQRFAFCVSQWESETKQDGYKPTQEMARVADRALEWRKEYGRGGTAVGVARARDIANRANLSSETVARMRSFFARHGVNRSEHHDAEEPDGGPTAWRIAWDLWGGDPARTWSERIGRQEDEKRMADTMEKKSLNLQIKSIDEDGTIEGYGAVFGNTDSYGDIIEPGAFRETLSMRKPKMLWQHNMAEPIGAWDEYREDARGLYMKGRIAIKTTRGRDAHELAKMGGIDGLSIGYVTRDYEMDGNNRRLKAIDLYETSLVTMPANSAALLTSVKNADVRDIEGAFRQMGFSRSEAKAMATAAWKRRDDILREAGVTGPEVDQREVDELKRLLMAITAK